MMNKLAIKVALLLIAPAALAEPDTASDDDPFAFLLEDEYRLHNPSAQRAAHSANDRGEFNFTLQYVSDDNFTFGRYNFI